MAEQWNVEKTYLAGERCRYKGEVYEARFDLCRRLRPEGTHHEKFWRKLPRISVPFVKQSSVRQPPTGYLTRDMHILSRSGK